MSKTEIMNKLTRTVHRVGFQLKKHSPEILVVAGTVGTVASAVMACKATLKVNEVVTEAKTNIEKIHTATEKGVTEAGLPFSVEDSKKDLTLVYAQTGLKLVKLYAPAVILGTLSLGAILTSNNILRTRNASLAAAYAALDKGYKEYRNRVIERFGKEMDRELLYNLKTEQVEEKVVNEDGTETTVKKTVTTYDNNLVTSPYTRIFDCGNTGWDDDPFYTKKFLICQQNYANELLKSQGYLFFNDVLKMLGYKATAIGQQVGWIYDEKNPIGDNFVDFGFMDKDRPDTVRFMNEEEKAVLLEFNVDGNILNYL